MRGAHGRGQGAVTVAGTMTWLVPPFEPEPERLCVRCRWFDIGSMSNSSGVCRRMTDWEGGRLAWRRLYATCPDWEEDA